MVNLGKCLKYLMNRHGQVTVVGLGTFSQVEEPGYYDPEVQSFYPARRQYSFSPESLSDLHQDLIVDYISVQRKIDKNTAQAVFRRALTALFGELESQGSAVLAGLGTLRQENDSLSFQTIADDQEAMNNLAVRELPILEAIPAEPDMAEPAIAEPAIAEQDITVEALNPGEESASNRRGRRVWWVPVVVLLLAAGAVLWKPGEIHSFLNSRGVEIAFLANLADKSSDKVAETPIAAEVAEIPSLDQEVVMADVDSAVVDTPMEEEPKVTFEIIVGSFTTMEQAYEFVEEMKVKGIEVKAMDSRMPGNRKKVSVASYPTQAEAYRALKEVQRNIESGAWVARVERD